MAAPVRCMPAKTRPIAQLRLIRSGSGYPGRSWARAVPAGAPDSLLGQTLRAREVIVVQTGGAARSDVKPVRAASPLPISAPAAARNAGLALCARAAVLFLDADDYLTPTHCA